MLEHNKNLSSIIGTIQDEGPPAGASEQTAARTQAAGDTAGPAGSESIFSTAAGQQRSALRPLLYLLFATLIIAATVIFVMGGRAGSPVDGAAPADVGEPPVSAIVMEQEAVFSGQEIYERQSLIMTRLDELTATMAEIKAGNDQYRADNRTELKRIQQEFQHSIENVSATVAGLQRGAAARDEASVQLAKGMSAARVVQTESELQGGGQQESPARVTENPNDVSLARPKSGGVPVTGGWVVNVVSSEHIEPVNKLMARLHKRGIPAETQQVVVGGKVRFRLRIPGFSTSNEARDYARNLDGDLNLKDPWVSKR